MFGVKPKPFAYLLDGVPVPSRNSLHLTYKEQQHGIPHETASINISLLKGSDVSIRHLQTFCH